MCNAANKLLLAALAPLLLNSCSGGSEEKQARSMLEQATRQLKADAPDSALVLLDSLDKKFASQIDVRREAMAVRAQAMTASLERRIFETDSMIIVCQTEVDRLMPMFAHAEVPGANGYYYMKGAYGPDISKSDGVQARLSDVDFSYYIVAANSGKKIGISQITLTSPEGNITSAEIPESDSRRGDTDTYGTDFASFATQEADTLGAWAYGHGNTVTSVRLSGALGSRDLSLTGPRAEQFGTAWRLGVVGAKLVSARRLKEKLERQVIIARDHAANLTPEPSGDQQPNK